MCNSLTLRKAFAAKFEVELMYQSERLMFFSTFCSEAVNTRTSRKHLKSALQTIDLYLVLIIFTVC